MPAKAVNMSEKDEFLKDQPEDGVETKDAFGEEIPLEVKEEIKEPEAEPRKNRQYRRLEAKYQAERESAIQLGARLEALTEVQKFRQEAGTEKPDETLARIYGTNTPEGAEATRLLQSALDARENRAVAKALETFRKEQEAVNKEAAKELENLNQIEERIEYEYGVDFSTEQGKRLSAAYFSYLEKLSPKDAQGNVKDYADPFATWEEFSKRPQQSSQTNRSKDLASRGMVRSGASSETKLETSAQERYLKEIGII